MMKINRTKKLVSIWGPLLVCRRFRVYIVRNKTVFTFSMGYPVNLRADRGRKPVKPIVQSIGPAILLIFWILTDYVMKMEARRVAKQNTTLIRDMLIALNSSE